MTRKHVELDFTMPTEAASITIGLHRAAVRGLMEHPVHLFPADAGILAAVTLEDACCHGDGVEEATLLALDEMEEHLPVDIDPGTIPEPWRVLIIDHDGMEANLLASRNLPRSNDTVLPKGP